MDKQLPSIYSYTDFRRYLADYQARRMETEKDFTKSYICKALGLPNTRGFFSSVIAGRKLTPMYVERFIRVLKLERDEARYFRILVRLDQADDSEERNQLFRRMLRFNKVCGKRINIDQYQYYSKWYYGAIRALVAVGDYRDDYERIARDLKPAIRASQAQEAIRTLKRLQLIALDNDGYYRPTESAITTGSFAEGEAIKLYQLQCFELAAAARRRMQFEDSPQDFATNNIYISKQACSAIRERLNRFREEVCAIAAGDDGTADCVYQLDVAFFPITERARNEKRG